MLSRLRKYVEWYYQCEVKAIANLSVLQIAHCGLETPMWRHSAGDIMAACPTAPGYYLNQYWLLTSGVSGALTWELFCQEPQQIFGIMILNIKLWKLLQHVLAANELMFVSAIHYTHICVTWISIASVVHYALFICMFNALVRIR